MNLIHFNPYENSPAIIGYKGTGKNLAPLMRKLRINNWRKRNGIPMSRKLTKRKQGR